MNECGESQIGGITNDRNLGIITDILGLRKDIGNLTGHQKRHRMPADRFMPRSSAASVSKRILGTA